MLSTGFKHFEDEELTFRLSLFQPNHVPGHMQQVDCHCFSLIMFQGICSKCQPSAVTLNRQPWRHTDSVMFENSQLVDRFVCFAGVQNLSLPAILRLSLPIASQPAISRLSLPGSFSFGEKVVLSALAGSMAGARNPLAFKLSWISKNLDKIPII